MDELKHRFKGSEWLRLIRDLMLLVFDSDKEFELVISEYKEKRSLRANNYSWALTDKLAEKMLVAGVKLSKPEMHAEMIFRYGQPEYDGDQAVIFSTRAGVDVSQYYEYAKEIGQSETNGKMFSHWRIYRPSHTYSKDEFRVFLAGITAECREQGIETKTPDEIARMISLIKEADDGK